MKLHHMRGWTFEEQVSFKCFSSLVLAYLR